MIYIPLPNQLLIEHKVITREDGQLKKDLLKLQTAQRDNISTPILSYIINNLERIICCSFEELKLIQNEYMDLIYSLESHFRVNEINQNMAEISKFNDINRGIFDAFIKAYKAFTKRDNSSWNSYIFLKELGQNVCPYCNANFIHTVQSSHYLSNAASRGMADLDHFLPKSIFPIFAVTLSNLVPSCIYCNQRFKSAYYTSMCRNISPYDSKIEGKMRFKINYGGHSYKSVFEKLEEISVDSLPTKELYYIKLLSFDKFGELKEFIDYSEEIRVEIEMLLINLYAIRNLFSEHKALMKNFIEMGITYIRKLKNLKSVEISELLDSRNEYILNFETIFNEFNLARKDYEERIGKKQQQRAIVTNVKDKIKKHLEKTKKILDFNSSNEVNEDSKINFVDIFLGKSLNYQIEIDADGDLDSEKYKVYNNAALFQIEARYNEYRRYINRKIEQSYVLNRLYRDQLQEQFPNLFQEYSIDSLSNLMLVDRESQHSEILGKLIYDLIVPNVKAQESMAQLKI